MVKTLGIEQFAPMNHIYRFYELNDYMKSIAEIGYHSMDLWTCGSHISLTVIIMKIQNILKN